ncbi:MAG: hypothetical protein RLZZ244_2260 [Verrucomicrobiota bacterium]
MVGGVSGSVFGAFRNGADPGGAGERVGGLGGGAGAAGTGGGVHDCGAVAAAGRGGGGFRGRGGGDWGAVGADVRDDAGAGSRGRIHGGRDEWGGSGAVGFGGQACGEAGVRAALLGSEADGARVSERHLRGDTAGSGGFCEAVLRGGDWHGEAVLRDGVERAARGGGPASSWDAVWGGCALAPAARGGGFPCAGAGCAGCALVGMPLVSGGDRGARATGGGDSDAHRGGGELPDAAGVSALLCDCEGVAAGSRPQRHHGLDGGGVRVWRRGRAASEHCDGTADCGGAAFRGGGGGVPGV